MYAAADHGTGGRPNYDIYWMNVDTGKETRITFAPEPMSCLSSARTAKS